VRRGRFDKSSAIQSYRFFAEIASCVKCVASTTTATSQLEMGKNTKFWGSCSVRVL